MRSERLHADVYSLSVCAHFSSITCCILQIDDGHILPSYPVYILLETYLIISSEPEISLLCYVHVV